MMSEQKAFFFIDTKTVDYDRDNYRDDRLNNRVMFFGTWNEAASIVDAYNKTQQESFDADQNKKINAIRKQVTSTETKLASLLDIDDANAQHALRDVISNLKNEIKHFEQDIARLSSKRTWKEGDKFMEFNEVEDMQFNWYIDSAGKIQTYTAEQGYSYNLDVWDLED